MMKLAVLFMVMQHAGLMQQYELQHTRYNSHTRRAGAAWATGVVLEKVRSVIVCGAACTSSDTCTGANYSPANATCTLLHVEDGAEDWSEEEEEEVTFLTAESGLASIGVWSFIEEAVNLRNRSSLINTFNTPFAPAFPGSTTNVLSFTGNLDSYVLLGNSNGALALTSFTWVVKLFPQSTGKGQIFGWYLNFGGCYFHGPHIWLNNQRLFFKTCSGSSISPFALTHSRVLSLNVWHDVAASYDATTGWVDLYVDALIQSRYIGLPGQGITDGPVVFGSRYHWSDPAKRDSRVYKGKMACMRLWNVSLDLNTLRMETPLCKLSGNG